MTCLPRDGQFAKALAARGCRTQQASRGIVSLARRGHQLLSCPAQQVVEPGVECDALTLAHKRCCRDSRAIQEARARRHRRGHTRAVRALGARRRGPRALARATREHVRFEPTRGPPLHIHMHMVPSPLGSHLPGIDGGILKETSMILLTA